MGGFDGMETGCNVEFTAGQSMGWNIGLWDGVGVVECTEGSPDESIVVGWAEG